MGKPVQSDERLVSISLPITQNHQNLDQVFLVFSSRDGGLSAPLAIKKNKGMAMVYFSIGVKHLEAARLSAKYSNNKNDSIDFVYSIQLKPFIQEDQEGMFPKK